MTKRIKPAPYRPAYDPNSWTEEVVSLRRFARVAGVRNAATAMRKQGFSLDEALRVLASISTDRAVRFF